MNNFRTFDSAVNFYQRTQQLKLTGIMRDQLHRSALSIALNLAEGRGRHSVTEQKRFFNIALASARECQAILLIAGMKESDDWKQLDKAAAQIYQLIKFAG
jgi:four helix bundle protein